MPRKKVILEENPEQVNNMEMEPQALEEGAEGMEQPPDADVPQEDVTSPARRWTRPRPAFPQRAWTLDRVRIQALRPFLLPWRRAGTSRLNLLP